MNELLNAIFVIILTLNLFALGNGRLLSVIRIVAFQGILLGILPLLIHSHLTFSVILSSLAAITLKGLVIPGIMKKALRDKTGGRTPCGPFTFDHYRCCFNSCRFSGISPDKSC
jgi:hydrogenase-4 membrane subunit HyfE